MRIIKPFVQFIPQPRLPGEILKHVELCGRVCYKSENRITEDSAEGFVQRIIARGHEAVLEHGNIVIQIGYDADEVLRWLDNVYNQAKYAYHPIYLRRTGSFFAESVPMSKHLREAMVEGVDEIGKGVVVSGNVRAWRDTIRFTLKNYDLKKIGVPKTIAEMLREYGIFFRDLVDDIKSSACNKKEDVKTLSSDDLLSKNEILAHRCETVRFIVDRGVSHEIVRHRPASYCQESTRYCNYAKGDFGGEITVIQPRFFQFGTPLWNTWIEACTLAEQRYFDLLNEGATAQEARTVLPNSLKTELIMTATLAEWLHFFKLRCADTAHPQMREVATQARELMSVAVPVLKTFLDEVK